LEALPCYIVHYITIHDSFFQELWWKKGKSPK
jgi:hypothetical protein